MPPKPRKRPLPPGIRKLPSGLYQATVYGPDGKRHTKTDPLQRVVEAWRHAEKTRIAQGRWRDPRAGLVPVTEYAETWFAARVVEPETRRGDRGVLNNHILPYWKTWKLSTIGPLDVQAWVRTMQQQGVGAHAIRRAYNLFRTMCSDAVVADILGVTPCRNVNPPATPPKLPAWFTHDQVERIRAELREPSEPIRFKGTTYGPGYAGHAAMVALMTHVGLRWGEAAGVVGAARPDEVGNPVDWLRHRIRVVGTMSQNGQWKQYPKSRKSRREVPVPKWVTAEMAALMKDRESTELVFVTGRGAKPLRGANWRVVWYAALDRANRAIEDGNRRLPKDQRVAPIPRLDPHDCRHTAASWLVQDGVPLYDVQLLLGHESQAMTMRYAHLAPNAHAAVEKAWKKRVTHQARTGS